jgi:hypothetical protein
MTEQIMWQIVKAEFEYMFKMILLVAGFIIPGALLYMRVSPTAGISAMLLPLTAATIFQPLIMRSIEKRERQQVLLPLPIRRIAAARLLLVVVPTLLYYGLYMILHLSFKHFSPLWFHDIFDVLMFFGLILFGFSLYLILRDLLISNFSHYKPAEFDAGVLVIIVSIIFLGIPIALATQWGISGNILRILCFFAGFVLLYPVVLSFTKRKTYLE